MISLVVEDKENGPWKFAIVRGHCHIHHSHVPKSHNVVSFFGEDVCLTGVASVLEYLKLLVKENGEPAEEWVKFGYQVRGLAQEAYAAGMRPVG